MRRLQPRPPVREENVLEHPETKQNGGERAEARGDMRTGEAPADSQDPSAERQVGQEDRAHVDGAQKRYPSTHPRNRRRSAHLRARQERREQKQQYREGAGVDSVEQSGPDQRERCERRQVRLQFRRRLAGMNDPQHGQDPQHRHRQDREGCDSPCR